MYDGGAHAIALLGSCHVLDNERMLIRVQVCILYLYQCGAGACVPMYLLMYLLPVCIRTCMYRPIAKKGASNYCTVHQGERGRGGRKGGEGR